MSIINYLVLRLAKKGSAGGWKKGSEVLFCKGWVDSWVGRTLGYVVRWRERRKRLLKSKITYNGQQRGCLSRCLGWAGVYLCPSKKLCIGANQRAWSTRNYLMARESNRQKLPLPDEPRLLPPYPTTPFSSLASTPGLANSTRPIKWHFSHD